MALAKGAHAFREKGRRRRPRHVPEERIVVWQEGEQQAEEERGRGNDHVGAEWSIRWLAVWVIVDLHSEEPHLGGC